MQVTNKANEGDNFVDGYFYWDSAPGRMSSPWAKYEDSLDLDSDSDMKE